MTDLTELQREFTHHFGGVAQWFRAPGRVNLIGDHTDYNQGLVLPAAIQLGTTVGIAPRTDRRVCAVSTRFEERFEAEWKDAAAPLAGNPSSRTHWSAYILGVAQALEQFGIVLPGADILIHSDVPLGAGLSSSAALEVAIALALASLTGETLDRSTLAALCQRAENEYVGVRCGIMDQYSSLFGRAGHALKIDCRSLQHEFVPLDPQSSSTEQTSKLVICNTMFRHTLAGSAYNRRREECETGVRELSRAAPHLESLRDVSIELLESQKSVLDPTLFRRVRHVVTENARVSEAAAALKAADLVRFGQLMRESHRSLCEDFEVSCQELDLLAQLAESIDGVYGSRMTGGGFGGCTVNLVRADAVVRFRALVAARYTAATERPPEIYVCEAVDGAGPLARTPLRDSGGSDR
jgi:galactokinase